MGAPVKDISAAEATSAEALLTALSTIDPAERRRHASVFNYWLSIRGNRQFPAIRDLDPLEISDAGPSSVLMEMIGGGEDAEIRHLGHAIKAGVDAHRISDVPAPSLLSCIHAKLPVVTASRQAYAFEDRFDSADGPIRCWVTLLPLSASGTWIDFVYAFVSLDNAGDAEASVPTEMSADTGETSRVELRPYDEDDSPSEAPAPEAISEPDPIIEPAAEPGPIFEPEPEPEPEPVPAKVGFSSKLLDGLASVGGFYGRSTPVPEEEPRDEIVAFDEPGSGDAFEPEQEPEPEPDFAPESQHQQATATPPPLPMEGSMQDKLSGVRAMAEDARQAQERSNLALYQGLGAAYDFALDAEDQPEDYLRLVEAQGLKIQLRSPMTPVVKLAFAGLTDDDTIRQLEGVLAWALKNDLPRGSLADRIQAEGGVGRILAGNPG